MNPITNDAEIPRSLTTISDASRQRLTELSFGNDWHEEPLQSQFGLSMTLYDANAEPSSTYQLSEAMAVTDRMQQRAERSATVTRSSATADAVTRPQHLVLVSVRTTGRSINITTPHEIYPFLSGQGKNCCSKNTGEKEAQK